MPNPIRRTLTCLPLLAVAAAPATRPATGPAATDVVQEEGRMRQVLMGCLLYMAEHKAYAPADLGQILPSLTNRTAEVFVTPADQRQMPPLPAPVTADWVTAHTSLVYLAGGVKISKVHNPAATAMAHTKVDEPLTDAKGLPVVVVGYADGHVEALPVDRAKAELAASTKAMDAAKPKR